MAPTVRPEDPARPWHEPGTYEVEPGVYRLPLPLPEDGLRAVNTYVVATGSEAGRLTVIDPGPGVEVAHDALVAGLAALGAGPGDVDRALVTHVHYDHYTNAVALRRRYPTAVWLGRHEEPSIARLRAREPSMGGQAAQLARYGEPELARLAAERGDDTPIDGMLREGPDRWVEDEDAVEVADSELTALHTPGHTRGHVVLRDEARSLLFAGDHVLPTITPSLGFEPAPTSQPLADYLGSLARIRALPDTRLLPAHGAVTASVHERIDELVAHHDARLEATLDAVRGGASTAVEVAGRLRWTRRERHLDELDRFNRMLAVLETGFHLDLQVARGALRVVGDAAVAHYLTA